MRFLDQKEEVIDIQLTPTGTRLLQLGAFKPSRYCFFDDDVLYDGRWAGINGETQNEIEARIQDVPRLQARRVKYSVEDMIHRDVYGTDPIAHYDIFQAWSYLSFLGASQLFADSDFFDDMLGLSPTSAPILSQVPINRTYTLYGPLGNMGFNTGDALPRWDIKFLKAPLTGSTAVTGSMGEDIYQLDVDLEYKINIEKTTTLDAVEADYDLNDPLGSISIEEVGTSMEDLNTSTVSLDGTYIQVIDDYLFLRIEEENTRFFKENFEIEVYRIDDMLAVPNSTPWVDPSFNPQEKRLFFDNTKIPMDAVLSGDNPQDFPFGEEKSEDWLGADYASKMGDEDAEGIADYGEVYGKRFVEYFFDVLVDESIPDEIFCKAMSKDETTFSYLDKQMFDCKNIELSPDRDPYDMPDEPTEACD